MAQQITETVVKKEARSLVVRVDTVGDGSGDLKAFRLERCGRGTLVRISGELGFDATIQADVGAAVHLPANQQIDFSWRRSGGVPAALGLTLSTNGLKAGDRGSLTLEARIEA